MATLMKLGCVGLAVPLVANADCATAWNAITLFEDCEQPARGSPSESCPAPCQTYFTGILDACAEGDVVDVAPDLALSYSQYCLWGEWYAYYPTCNLGYNATACDVALVAVEVEAMSIWGFVGSCEKSANSPCTAECSALVEAVNTHCSESPATYVATSGEGRNTWTQQTYRQQTIDNHFNNFLFDETCVALVTAPATSGGSPTHTVNQTYRSALKNVDVYRSHVCNRFGLFGRRLPFFLISLLSIRVSCQ